jgi:hypothetical protein
MDEGCAKMLIQKLNRAIWQNIPSKKSKSHAFSDEIFEGAWAFCIVILTKIGLKQHLSKP